MTRAGSLHKAYWHRSPDELSVWRPGTTRKRLIVQYVGLFKVRTWLNPDGKPICTGWFWEV